MTGLTGYILFWLALAAAVFAAWSGMTWWLAGFTALAMAVYIFVFWPADTSK